MPGYMTRPDNPFLNQKENEMKESSKMDAMKKAFSSGKKHFSSQGLSHPDWRDL